jgi:hypothetical protein
MKKILGILLLGFLFSGKANAGINEPGISLLSPQCKLNFKIEHDKIKKSLKKNQTAVLYGSCNNGRWSYASDKGKNLKRLHKKTFKECMKYADEFTGTECFLYAVNEEVVWKHDKVKEAAILEERQAQLNKRPGNFFIYNIDDSLPKKWVAEFENIMNVLQDVIPIPNNMNEYLKNPGMDIYAWKSSKKNPFPKVKNNMKGACICGNGSDRWMQLEINSNEFKNKEIHRYSVIPHEYFHVYQIALSKNKLSDRDSPKWLTEGQAKVFEEMYVKQYYEKDNLKNDLSRTKKWSKKVFKEPELYEKHKTSNKKGMDGNYAGSAFMVLALINELEQNNISERKAFQLVFRDFWIERAKNRKWEKAFEQTFKISAEEFYERLSKYKRKDYKTILPSDTIKIQEIFS